MSRGLWFVAGAGAGLYAAVRARRAAEILTVDGLRDRVGAAVVGARMMRAEYAQGKADAEFELRERLGNRLHEHRELPSGARSSLGAAAEAAPHDTDLMDQTEEEGTS